MKRKFIETPEFQRLCKKGKVKEKYIRALQIELLENPQKGDLIVGSGALEKYESQVIIEEKVEVIMSFTQILNIMRSFFCGWSLTKRMLTT